MFVGRWQNQFYEAGSIKQCIFENVMSVIELKEEFVHLRPSDYVFCASLGRMPLEGHSPHSVPPTYWFRVQKQAR